MNAIWDLFVKREGKPLWKLLSDMSPQEIVALVDWRYLRNVLTPDEAVDLLETKVPGRTERTKRLVEDGIPSYTTSPAGSATATRGCAGCARRPSTRAGRT